MKTEPQSPTLPSATTERAAAILARAAVPPPLLVVISGPSGVGKDAVVRSLLARPLGLQFIVTATTRRPRPDEVPGRDYVFLSAAEFERLRDNGELLEHAYVYGEHKGIPKAHVRQALEQGKDAVLRIDVQGAATIRRILPQAVEVMLVTESLAELERRLRERRSEPESALAARLAAACREIERAAEFDYVVANRRDQLEHTADVLEAIILAERHRWGREPVRL